MGNTYRAPVVKRAFSVLERIARSRSALTVSELAEQLAIGKSTVLGILAALEEVGAVVRDPATLRYRLGLTLFELGRAVDAGLDLKDIARPHLGKLMARTRQSVFLGVRAGDHVTVLDIVESSEGLKITAPVGTRLPLLAGATGKAFLSTLPEDEVRALVGGKALRKYTPNTITDPEQYLAEVAEAKRNGYALDHEEYILGVRAVAAPIPDGDSLSAAIWVVGFTPSLASDTLASIGRDTKSAAEAVGRRLGH